VDWNWCESSLGSISSVTEFSLVCCLFWDTIQQEVSKIMNNLRCIGYTEMIMVMMIRIITTNQRLIWGYHKRIVSMYHKLDAGTLTLHQQTSATAHDPELVALTPLLTSYKIFLRWNLKLSSHLFLCLSHERFPAVFPIIPYLFHLNYTPSPS
jgi:hypothetical protein